MLNFMNIIKIQDINFFIFYFQGIGNIVGSFFSCIAFAASLSRSIVAKGVGGRTQVTAFVSGLIIIVTLLWIADFFAPLPRVSQVHIYTDIACIKARPWTSNTSS
jgi:MFS superfamily sulfate permease-like transporter